MMKFQLYRFQILPIDHSQMAMFDKSGVPIDLPGSVDELIRRKNDIFASVLPQAIQAFTHYGKPIQGRVEFAREDVIVLRFAVARSVSIEPEPFAGNERLPNWPSFYGLVNNDPQTQIIALQAAAITYDDTRGFSHTLESGINDLLSSYNLHVTILPIYSSEEFWDVIAANRGEVTQVKFELTSPNMPRIAGTLATQLLESLKKENNVQESDFTFKSDPRSSLRIEPNDTLMADLADYAATGGGKAYIKISSVKKRLTIGKVTQSVTVDEIVIVSDDYEHVTALVRELTSLPGG